MSLGILIAGIIIAVLGYCLERFTSGLLATLGKIMVIIGVVIAIIGLILILLDIAGVALMTLPPMLA